MNYIYQLNAFWEHEKKEQLSSSTIALYLSLLHINNRSLWKEIFSIDPLIVMDISNIGSLKTLFKQLKILKDLELIEYFPSKNQHLPTRLKIKRLYNGKESLKKKLPEQGDSDSLPGAGAVPEQVDEQNPEKTDLQPESEKPKQINNEKVKICKQENIFSLLQELYVDFIEKRTGIRQSLSKSDLISLKNITLHLENSQTDAPKLWKKLLDQWDKQNDFYKGQIKLYQIEKNLVNLLNQLNNTDSGVNNSHASRKEFNLNV